MATAASQRGQGLAQLALLRQGEWAVEGGFQIGCAWTDAELNTPGSSQRVFTKNWPEGVFLLPLRIMAKALNVQKAAKLWELNRK